jgi:hypothetical protein
VQVFEQRAHERLKLALVRLFDCVLAHSDLTFVFEIRDDRVIVASRDATRAEEGSDTCESNSYTPSCLRRNSREARARGLRLSPAREIPHNDGADCGISRSPGAPPPVELYTV